MHLLETKEGIVVLDVGRIDGSEGVEVEHRWRARGRCDAESSGGQEGKERRRLGVNIGRR